MESVGEYTDSTEGIFIRVSSPLSVVVETEWKIINRDEGLELMYNSKVAYSRALVSFVKGGWEDRCKAC